MIKSVGVNDVARLCGVSASTVCRALNSKSDINAETKTRIINACDELGYTRNSVASNLRLKKNDTVICLLPSATSEMSTDKIFHLKQAAMEHDCRFRHTAFDNIEEAKGLLAAAIGERPAGVILGFVPSVRMSNALRKNGIATTCYDCFSADFNSVTLNRTAGIKESVTAMIKNGRTKIALLGGSAKSVRGKAYTAALQKADLPLDPALIVNAPFGRDLFAYGYEQGKIMLNHLDFDAVQCVNDACAIGLIRALSESGRQVPDDISIAGFDDIMVSQYQVPALSTVSQPKETMAAETIRMLFNKSPLPEQVILETSFINRESL